jgi:hypothetical protein
MYFIAQNGRRCRPAGRAAVFGIFVTFFPLHFAGADI